MSKYYKYTEELNNELTTKYLKNTTDICKQLGITRPTLNKIIKLGLETKLIKIPKFKLERGTLFREQFFTEKILFDKITAP